MAFCSWEKLPIEEGKTEGYQHPVNVVELVEVVPVVVVVVVVVVAAAAAVGVVVVVVVVVMSSHGLASSLMR